MISPILKTVLAMNVLAYSASAQELNQSNRALRGYVAQQKEIILPPVFENYAENSSPVRHTDIPVYWHVLKSGGTTMKHIFSQCFHFVIADENDHGTEDVLRIVWEDGSQYVNVDTSTPQGIAHAKSLHLAQSRMANVAITPHVHEMGDIFDPQHKGRLFAMIRHPIDRAVSMFYYLQRATWEPSYDPRLQDMTIEDYAKSDRVEENWMTRFLTGKKTEPLGPHDVVLAREILRRKFVVGLLSRTDESVKRFIDVMGWDTSKPERMECINNLVHNGMNRHEHPPIERGSDVWDKLMEYNKYDMELYIYAVQLFQEQFSSLAANDFMDF